MTEPTQPGSLAVEPAVLDALPDALLVVRDDRVAWASAAARRMFRARTLAARPLASLLEEDDRRRLAVLEEQRAAGWYVPDTCRVRLVRDDGSRVKVDLRFAHARFEGAPALVLAARDVTENERAEALMGRLAELSSNALLDENALLDAADPIFVALGWRGAFTEIRDASSVTTRAIAAPPGDPIGDYARSIVGRELPLERTPILAEVKRAGRALFLDNVPAVLAGPRSNAVELSESMERARLTRSAWCPVRVGGRITHLLTLSGKDLTEHDFVAIQLFAAQIGSTIQTARLRAELVRRERLAAVGEMAAVLAHEVRNPIGVVFNAVRSLERVCTGQQEAEALIGIVGEEADRLRKLVRELLEFARPPQPTIEPVDVGAAVAQAVEAARRELAEAGDTTIEVRIAEQLPLVAADAALLRRALVNLVVNALQHVPRDGRVTLTVEAEGEREVRVRVHNDGAPIPPADAARIFEPFFTTRATGTGLGLPIVRRIVEDLRGRVALDPSGPGVAFVLTLQTTRDGAA